MKRPLDLTDLGVREVAPPLPAEDSFFRRQAALRHQRRSRRLRTMTATVLWALVLLLIGGFLAVEIITGFKLA